MSLRVKDTDLWRIRPTVVKMSRARVLIVGFLTRLLKINRRRVLLVFEVGD
jgi:hypothetical protein